MFSHPAGGCKSNALIADHTAKSAFVPLLQGTVTFSCTDVRSTYQDLFANVPFLKTKRDRSFLVQQFSVSLPLFYKDRKLFWRPPFCKIIMSTLVGQDALAIGRYPHKYERNTNTSICTILISTGILDTLANLKGRPAPCVVPGRRFGRYLSNAYRNVSQYM